MWWKGAAWSLVSFCICSRGRSPLSSCHQQSKARVPDRCRNPKKDAHNSGYVLQRDIQKLQALLCSRGLGECRTDGGSSSLSEVLAGPPLAASRPRPDSDRANDTSLAEWMDEDSFISMMTGRCSFSFHPSVDTWEKKKLLRMTTFSAMVEKLFLLVNNDIITYQCTIKSNCNTFIGLIFFYYVKYVFQLLKNVKLNVAHLIKKTIFIECLHEETNNIFDDFLFEKYSQKNHKL